MSWQGYLQWLQHRRHVFEHALQQRPAWEARDIAERALYSLLRTAEFAKKQNQQEAWQELQDFFYQGLLQVDNLEQEALSIYWPESFEAEMSQNNDQIEQLWSQARADYAAGRFQQALDGFYQIFAQGARDVPLLELIVRCARGLNQHQDVLHILNRSLQENRYSAQDRAKLYFELGQTYLEAEQPQKAWASFGQVRDLQSDYPGLDKILQKLDKYRKKFKSRYDWLLDQHLLDKKQLAEASDLAWAQDLDLEQILLQEYQVSKTNLGKSLSVFYGVAFVPFNPQATVPVEILEQIGVDSDYLKRHCWVPFGRENKSVTVLLNNPFDLGKLDEIRFVLGMGSIESKVALKQDIEAYIDIFFEKLRAKASNFTEFDQHIEIQKDNEESFHDLEEIVSEQESEVVRLVNALLLEAWKQGASDIHIEPNTVSRNCSIRFRVDGSCHEFRKLRLGLARPLVSRVKIMSRLDIAERRLPQDGKARIKLPQVNQQLEFRVATMPTIDGMEDVVLRVLSSGKTLSLQDLGLGEGTLEAFQDIIHQPYGMVLVVGPTGSGKTTTLHSALHCINTADKKIWTAEDPVEITQEGLRQVQVNPRIGLNFASALRSFLRSDPDVIMIGEMRDRETAHIGVEASLTGHLVFSTLHTNSAPETVTRLLDMELDPFNFADSLLSVLAQRLVKTLCAHCKEPYRACAEEVQELQVEFGANWQQFFPEAFLQEPVLYRARGCEHCLQGYRGRIGVHELMLNSPELKPLIKQGQPTEELRRIAVEQGMLTLKQDGLLKVLSGVTDLQQVRQISGKS